MKREVDLVAEPGERVEVRGYFRWIPGEVTAVHPETEQSPATYEVRTDDGDQWIAAASGIRKPQAAPEQP
jgi:hypothetical protein